MSERLKDIYFTKAFVRELGDTIVRIYDGFDKKKFWRLVFDKNWEEKELKNRMHHLSYCLHEGLPEDYAQSLAILKKTAPYFFGFDAMVFPDYVEQYGLEEWDLSLIALGEFTKCCSSEFAIRSFIERDPKKAMQYLLKWADEKNEHVRRLASEGCRPRLPWARALPGFKKDPTPIIPILEKLKNDHSEYVRRSVANNLNDISKDHPRFVLDLCEKWYGLSDNTNGIVKHACRDMLKSGNKRAMRLFGFKSAKNISVENFKFDNENIHIGTSVFFSFDLSVNRKKKMPVRLEYIMSFLKSSGNLSPKVFQIKEDIFEAGTHVIRKKHSFQDFSTRKHYPGEHVITIVINGEKKFQCVFDLLNLL